MCRRQFAHLISTSEPDSDSSSRQNNYHPIEANGSKGRNNWNFVLSDLVLNISPILFHECKYCTFQLERTVHPIESYCYLYFHFSESHNIAFSTGHLLWELLLILEFSTAIFCMSSRLISGFVHGFSDISNVIFIFWIWIWTWIRIRILILICL